MAATLTLWQRLVRPANIPATASVAFSHAFGPVRSLGGLALALILAGNLAAQGSGTVTGRILSASSGQYLEGAEVSIEGSAIHGPAGRDGTYILIGVPAGSQVVVATYPGQDSANAKVDVKAGETATASISLGQEVIQLERFVVRGAKEGMAQAVALQKVSIQSKLVAAADQFGEVSEGNIGEYLKFLPGVTVDYNVNDARGISLRGLSTAFTIVGVDGTPMAGGSSVDDTRRFEFEQVAMNNVETTELFKTVTPDIPATSTGGFVNTGFVQGTGDNRLVLVRGQKTTTDIKAEYSFNKKISAYIPVAQCLQLAAQGLRPRLPPAIPRHQAALALLRVRRTPPDNWFAGFFLNTDRNRYKIHPATLVL